MTGVTFFLYLFGAVAIAGGLGMVLQRNPVPASLSLAVTFLALGGMFAALDAHFLAVIEIVVYAGLIQVLIIYTVMLMDLGEDDLKRKHTFARVLGALAGVLVLAQLGMAVLRGVSPEAAPAVPEYGTTAEVAQVLFGKYLLPFEVVSMLLLAGVVAAVMLAKSEKIKRGKTDATRFPTPIDTESSANPTLIKR
jgi:NADH-quinone oxidoreductase subunit J